MSSEIEELFEEAMEEVEDYRRKRKLLADRIVGFLDDITEIEWEDGEGSRIEGLGETEIGQKELADLMENHGLGRDQHIRLLRSESAVEFLGSKVCEEQVCRYNLLREGVEVADREIEQLERYQNVVANMMECLDSISYAEVVENSEYGSRLFDYSVRLDEEIRERQEFIHERGFDWQKNLYSDLAANHPVLDALLTVHSEVDRYLDGISSGKEAGTDRTTA